MSSPQLTKAVLIPMNGDQPETDETQHIIVQFNPTNLRVTLSNTLKADNAGGESSAAAQYIDKSESTLAVQLIFDTTVPGSASVSQVSDSTATQTTETQSRPSQANHDANSDVRILTKAVADTFMKPQNPEAERPSAPKRCRFQWGSFVFVGMVSSYNETLEFFSPEGVPLRASLSLTLKEDRYQFDTLDAGKIKRDQPTFAAGGDNVSAAGAAAAAKKNPKEWRDLALMNGMENPRLSMQAGLSIPSVSLSTSLGASASAGMGFSVGGSGSLGTSIPGAFSLSTSTAKGKKQNAFSGGFATMSAGVGTSASVKASAGIGINANIKLEG